MQDGRCYSCRDRRPRIRGMVRVGPYRDAMGPLVRAFKFHGRDELDAYLGRLLAEALELAPWRDEVEALVCVPTHWRHAINRGFYAPKALARVVSRRSNIPLLSLLRRVAAGPHQFDVPLNERAANIRGKFAVADGVEMNDATVCLIDDVSTTGSTLNECAKVLKQAGAETVYASVVAKVDAPSHS